MENTKIYICSHKEFEQIVHNDSYEVVYSKEGIKHNGDLKYHVCKDVDIPIDDDSFYSELYNYKWVADNLELPKYVGFCHYRKYFSFMDAVPNLDDDGEVEAVVARPVDFKYSIRETYDIFHNIEDLEIVESIVKEKYPQYYENMEKFLESKRLFPCNMFIMKREDFKEYIDFMFDVLNEYLNRIGMDFKKRLVDESVKYTEGKPSPNNTIEYQRRIGGYLGERLTNVFIYNKFTTVKWFPVNIIDGKYNDTAAYEQSWLSNFTR